MKWDKVLSISTILGIVVGIGIILEEIYGGQLFDSATKGGLLVWLIYNTGWTRKAVKDIERRLKGIEKGSTKGGD